MSDASDFLTKWVRKNITPTTAHICNDTLTAGRYLSAAEVTDAAGGNLLNFMVAELNRAADREVDEERE